MRNNGRREENIDLIELLWALLDKLWMVVALTLAAALIVGIYTVIFVKPVYQSVTSIYLRNPEFKEVNNEELSLATSLKKDYEVLIKSDTVLQEVIDDLSLDISVSQLSGMVTITNLPETRILAIAVKSNDPIQTKNIAENLANISAKQLVRLMGLEEVTIVDEAKIPIEPSGPSLKRNVVMGALVGCALACSMILLFCMMSDKIRTAEDVELYLKLSVLGSIPSMEVFSKAKKKRRLRNE